MNRYRKMLVFALSFLLLWPTSVGAKSALAEPQCAGDVNFDGTVNLFDLVAVAQAYNSSAAAPGSPCDVNDDGYVNLLDLVLVARDFGQCPGSQCIKAEDAARYVGQNVCVEFQVVHTWKTTEVAFLDSHYPFQGHFYVLIHKNKWSYWPQTPDVFFKDKYVRVQGLIEWYSEYQAPQIKLQSCSDIEVIQ